MSVSVINFPAVTLLFHCIQHLRVGLQNMCTFTHVYLTLSPDVFRQMGYKFDPAVSLRQQHLITNPYKLTILKHQTAWDCLSSEMELL